MAVFRVEKRTGYTVMSNYHLRDKNLSCKACGLLSKMLSLPDEWDYTIRGLAAICKDGENAIRTALLELEQYGYLKRSRRRDELGRVMDSEYIIYEQPNLEGIRAEEERKASCASQKAMPDCAFPDYDFHNQDSQTQDPHKEENDREINKERTSTEESSTEESIKDSRSSVLHHPPLPAHDARDEGMPVENSEEDEEEDRRFTSPKSAREQIREQIGYDRLCDRENRVQLDELVEIMVEVMINRSPTIRISREEEFPAAYVRKRFFGITSEHIETVLESIRDNPSKVVCTKAYLLAALFNAVSTLDHHYAMMVNADLNGGG